MARFEPKVVSVSRVLPLSVAVVEAAGAEAGGYEDPVARYTLLGLPAAAALLLLATLCCLQACYCRHWC